jgi:hypothetical protein
MQGITHRCRQDCDPTPYQTAHAEQAVIAVKPTAKDKLCILLLYIPQNRYLKLAAYFFTLVYIKGQQTFEISNRRVCTYMWGKVTGHLLMSIRKELGSYWADFHKQ